MSIAINPTPYYIPERSMSNVKRYALFFCILLMSALVFLSDDHRYGFAFLRELMAGLSILAFFYLLIFERARLETTDFYLLILAIMTFLVPSLFSYFALGQPLYLGISEERRTLAYFFFFLGLLVIGQAKYSPQQIERTLLVLFWLGLLWSIGCAYGIVPRNDALFFSVNQEHFQEGYVTDDTRFETRFLNGYILIFLYPLYLLAKHETAKGMLYFIPVALYMFFINQTRSLGAVLTISVFALLFFRSQKPSTIISIAVAVPIICFVGYLMYYGYAYATDQPVLFYDEYRNLEFSVLFRDAVKDFFLPHGNLSLHFGDRGFREHFGIGINVYTADIGLVGALYKYGVFYPFLLAMTMLISILLYRKYNNEFSLMLLAYMMGTCVLMPFDDHLSNFANCFAILLLLSRVQSDNNSGKKYLLAVRNI